MTIPLNALDFALKQMQLTRKHIPRDETSFYRCFAEMVHNSQRAYPQVRRELIDFCESSRKWKKFSHILRDEDMRPVSAMLMLAAECFEVPVIQFRENSSQLIYNVYDPFVEHDEPFDGSPICLAAYRVDGQDQYDLVLTERQVRLGAVAQAFAYEALYAGVFEMDREALQSSLDQMLREKTFSKLKQQRKYLSQRLGDGDLPQDCMSLPPIPYRIAKALDPAFYRNVEMDLWLVNRRMEREEAEAVAAVASLTHKEGAITLPVGTRCLSTLPDDPHGKKLVCYVVSKVDEEFQVELYVPRVRKKIRCDARNLQVMTLKRDRFHRPSPHSPHNCSASPDFRPPPGLALMNEHWALPHDVINFLSASQHRHYALPLMPPNCSPMRAAVPLLFPQTSESVFLAQHMHHPLMMVPCPPLTHFSPPHIIPGSGSESPLSQLSTDSSADSLFFNWPQHCMMSPTLLQLHPPLVVRGH